MNYLKLKERIEKAIHTRPMEVEPYNDLFDLCREYEKIFGKRSALIICCFVLCYSAHHISLMTTCRP